MTGSLSCVMIRIDGAVVVTCVVIAVLLQNLGAAPAIAATPSSATVAKPHTRLLDQQPFDRITLKASHGGETIDTLLLDLPKRRVPSPMPTDGVLELRRLSEPSVLYALSWGSISRIELYEQLLLDESVKLAKSRDSKQAYEYLSFLHKNYPQLTGLQSATETYLRLDALAAYGKQRYEEALAIILALYDINPKHQGLPRFVETVTDRMITAQLQSRDFAAARSVLDLLTQGFPGLPLANVSTWQSKFEQGANRQLVLARQALDKKRYVAARRAVRRALDILPTASGAEAMMVEIDRESPLVVVGVDQLSGLPAAGREKTASALEWNTRRIAQLTEPRLIQLKGFGAEGGEYRCPWADMVSDDTGLNLDFHLNAKAIRDGLATEVLALEFLKLADPHQPLFRADFGDLLNHVATRQGNVVNIHLKRSHVRPEALLPITVRNLTDSGKTPGTYVVSPLRGPGQSVTYLMPESNASGVEQNGVGPKSISEQFYDSDELALADLLSGELDVLARVPPWQVSRLQQTDAIVVSPYRLPMIHVLLPNYSKPIMSRREFRRALCYGIDRTQILNDILLGGERLAGYRVLSGPLPAGLTLTDPVGYAYNQGLQPRSYQPRLAAILATVARQAIARRANTEMASPTSLAAHNSLATASADSVPAKDGTTSQPAVEPVLPPAEPLILAHAPNSTATTACQTIKLQLDAIGIPVELKSLPGQASADQNEDEDFDWDLRYLELALWEPIVDARRLLGPRGLAGSCSSSMSLALHDLDQAQNWKQARSRLQAIHEKAYYDLPVIPLWQTIEFFARRSSLSGVGAKPVTLYQNVADWKRVTPQNRQGADR